MSSQERENLVNQVIDSYSDTMRLLKTYMHDSLAQQDIGPSQLQLLFCVATIKPAPTQKMLAQYLHVTPGALTQLIEPLVEHGLVTRVPSSTDRRILHVKLSASGKRKLQALKSKRSKLFADLLEPLTDNELQVMLNTQKKMFETLEHHHQTRKD